MAEHQMQKNYRVLFEQVKQEYEKNFEDPKASRQEKIIRHSLRKKRADIRRALEYPRTDFIRHVITRMDTLAPMINKKLYEVTVGDLTALFDRGIDYIRQHTGDDEFLREYNQYGHKYITFFYAIKRGKIIPDSQNPFLPKAE
jgi:hypothetical protein